MILRNRIYRRLAIPFALMAGTLPLYSGEAQQPLTYQDQLRTLAAKLEQAKSTQANLTLVSTCLSQYDTTLGGERRQLEESLGQLRSTEQGLAAKVQMQQAAYGQYRSTVEAETANVARLQKEITDLPGRERYERHKRNCASNNAYDRIACGKGMRYDFGRFDTIEANLNAARAREQTAVGSLNFARQNLDATQSELAATRSQLTSTEGAVAAAEQSIGGVKLAISQVKALAQPLRITIDSFGLALSEASDVTSLDERPRTLRKLADIASQIDASVMSGATAVSNIDQTLKPGWNASCVAA